MEEYRKYLILMRIIQNQKNALPREWEGVEG
jgi:hypothetical protein